MADTVEAGGIDKEPRGRCCDGGGAASGAYTSPSSSSSLSALESLQWHISSSFTIVSRQSQLTCATSTRTWAPPQKYLLNTMLGSHLQD